MITVSVKIARQPWIKKRSSNGKKTERERGTGKEKGNVRSKYHRITYELSAVCY